MRGAVKNTIIDRLGSWAWQISEIEHRGIVLRVLNVFSLKWYLTYSKGISPEAKPLEQMARHCHATAYPFVLSSYKFVF